MVLRPADITPDLLSHEEEVSLNAHLLKVANPGIIAGGFACAPTRAHAFRNAILTAGWKIASEWDGFQGCTRHFMIEFPS